MHHPTTLPLGPTTLMRASDFRHDEADDAPEGSAGATRFSSLNPSLLRDLQRFARHEGAEPAALELLEVLAAAVRHARALRILLEYEQRVLPLTVFPVEHQMHCPVPAATLLVWRLTELRVLQVEPAQLAPHEALAPGPQAELYAPLSPLLWQLALRGARDTLLPEISGPLAYRVVPGAGLTRLALGGTAAAVLRRLRRQTTSLRELAGWPGMDRERAIRLLNGLYLHAALRVSRTHPAATNELRHADGR